LLQRIISALVLAPIVLLIVWLGGWWMTALIAAAIIIGVAEIGRIFAAGSLHPRTAVATGLGLAFLAAVVFQSRTTVNLSGAALALAVIGSLLAEIWRRDRTGSLDAWAVTLAGALYVGGLLAHFVLLRGIAAPALRPNPLSGLKLAPGAAWIFATFAVTWASDSGAYFAGRAFGRTKMSPRLSPKKTWEGFAGGTLAAVGAGVGIVALLGLPVSAWVGVALGLIGSVGGTLGDLAESMLKRQAGVKDSGNLIPGHGGLLDRVDSLLWTAPLTYYLLAAIL
jgi:phosphatidate cytidylyltransferase